MYDFHTHFIPEEVLSWLKENKDLVNAQWIDKGENNDPFLVVNEKWGFELKKSFIDRHLYVSKQAEANIMHSVVSPIPQLFMYEFPVEITSEISGVYNHSLANWVNSSPKNLSALGTVPLNNPDKAAQMLNEAMSIGLKGVIIGPGLAEHMLSDDYFTPFFEEANRLKAIIFIHPLLSEDPQVKKKNVTKFNWCPLGDNGLCCGSCIEWFNRQVSACQNLVCPWRGIPSISDW